jgi:gamma-glutamylcyclotransferase (GGCT)/AIG2-like uncharacterized protein YtfP
MNEPLPIFVYGTLKRGEEREGKWPRRPTRPALAEGDDVVAGELWHLAPEDVEPTLKTLDAVEEVLPEGTGLYERRVVKCRNEAGQMLNAYAYFYARAADLAEKTPLASGSDGCVKWRGKS